MESLQLQMRILQGRSTPQGTFVELVSVERDGPTSESYLKTTVPADAMTSLDFGKVYRVTLEGDV